MKNLPFLLLASLLLFSCRNFDGPGIRGNGNISSEKRAVSGFTSIDVSGAIEVILQQSDSIEVKVETDQNLLSYITVRQENGVLSVHPANNSSIQPTKRVKVYISAPQLEGVTVSGASKLTADSKWILTNPISLDISGASQARVTLKGPSVKAIVSGASSMQLNGETKDFTLDVSSASGADCFGLLTENADVNSSSASNVEVYASVQLKASASSAGTIRYKGAANVTPSASSAGSVEKSE